MTGYQLAEAGILASFLAAAVGAGSAMIACEVRRWRAQDQADEQEFAPTLARVRAAHAGCRPPSWAQDHSDGWSPEPLPAWLSEAPGRLRLWLADRIPVLFAVQPALAPMPITRPPNDNPRVTILDATTEQPAPGRHRRRPDWPAVNVQRQAPAVVEPVQPQPVPATVWPVMASVHVPRSPWDVLDAAQHELDQRQRDPDATGFTPPVREVAL